MPLPVLLQRFKARARSLRFLIASTAILALGICFFVSASVIYSFATSQLRELATASMLRATDLLSFLLDHWLKELLHDLKILADSEAFRRLNKPAMAKMIEAIIANDPSRQIGVWTPDGRLIIGSHGLAVGMRDARLTRSSAFQEALRGVDQPSILAPGNKHQGCLIAARAIQAPAADGHTAPGSPEAVLTFCMSFPETTKEMAPLATAGRANLPPNKGGSFQVISLQNQRYRGAEVMVVTATGKVFFPLSNVNDALSYQTPTQIAAGPWGPFVRFARSDQNPRDQVAELSAAGQRFLVMKHRLGMGHGVLLMIVNYEASWQHQINITHTQYLLTSLLMALIIYYLSGKIVRPIQKASEAIRKISKGDFTVHIERRRDDEIGDLYADINATGSLLSAFVASEKSHAAADQQLATAHQIQRSFLLNTLPQSDCFELAARFLPAYQVGADWYDCLALGRFLYVVIADVCDKGVPSALFMSMFRTLLRTHILSQSRLLPDDQPVPIAHVASLVNDYVAGNHADSTMFATIFLASYDLHSGQLRYVNGGHECPLLLREKTGTIALESLGTTGPAVGVFPGADFWTGEVWLAPGDLLFSYTDGLTDARSPAQEGWGLERLRQFLLALSAEERSPATVLQKVYQTVEQFAAGADRFDDLTVLALRRSR